MPKSQVIRFALALEARGETHVPNARTGKYRVYTRKGGNDFYFLGVSGALRIGPAVSKSIPCSDKFKALLLGEADLILSKDRRAKPSFMLIGKAA